MNERRNVKLQEPAASPWLDEGPDGWPPVSCKHLFGAASLSRVTFSRGPYLFSNLVYFIPLFTP